MLLGPARTRVTRFVLPGLFLTVLLFASASSGQTYMFGRADFPTGSGPSSVIVADFNRDGIPDLAVSNAAANSISILLGKADGTFGPKVDFATGHNPMSLATGDFNGDGNIDLAVANSSDLTVSIFLGNGDGTFQSAVTFPTRNPPQHLVVGDLNGDGKLDIATVNTTFVTGTVNNSVSILLGKGDGTFAPSVDYPMDGASVSIASGDFNGDGKLDLAVGNPGLQVVSVLLGNGDGTFQTPANYGDGNGNYVTTYLVVGDFNADGNPDLASCGGGKVSVLLGNGDGTFQSHVDYALVGTENDWITVGDFNGDGKADLAVANGNGHGAPLGPYVSVLIGKGDGTFQAPINYNTGGQPFSVTSADVNGDGKVDLIMVTDANSVAVLIGRGDGTFSTSADYLGGAVPMSVTVGDFNGDGKLDLATANRGDNTVSVFLANGDGTFKDAASYAAGSVPRAVVATDLNGDGRDDLVVTDPTCSLIFPPCPATGAVSILLANGDGTFQTSVSYAVNGYPVSVAAGDFNGNGHVDLVVANGNSPGTVSVLLGKGDGTFQMPGDFATATIPEAVTVGDFNGDGRLDLAVASGAFSGVSILLGRGDGTFQAHSDYAAGGSPISVVTADFNNDGKLDLAVGNNSDSSISVLLGNGDGTFQSPTTYRSSHLQLTALTVGDFNGDGNADLAAVNNFDNTVTLFLGKGDGTFPTAIDYEYSAGGSSFGVTAANLRPGDRSDLAIANFNGGVGNSVSVLLNAPAAAVFPGKLSFASLAVGSSSSPQSIQLSNPSGAPLIFQSIVAMGDFSQTNDCGSQLPVGANCRINITFAPSAPFSRSGGVVITNNGLNNQLVISASGTGIGPSVGLAPASLAFGGQFVNSTSKAQVVMLTNTGNALLTITNFAVSGDFAQANQCGNTLAVNASCSIQVTFSPTAAGSRSGAITISDNVFGGQTTIALSGNGTDFSIGLAPGSSGNITVSAGATATYNLSVVPDGGLSGPVTFACSGVPSEATCSIAPTSVTLDGLNSAPATLTVTTHAASLLFRPIPGPLSPLRRLPLVLCLLSASLLAWLAAQGISRLAQQLRLRPQLTLVAMLLLGLALIACGGGGTSFVHNPGTPAGTYSLVVTATAGTSSVGVQHNLTLTLTVK